MKQVRTTQPAAVTEEPDTGKILPDPAGWPIHPSERRDFFNRIRFFPSEVSRWRRRLLEEIKRGDKRFPLATLEQPTGLADKLDAGISFLREIARILSVLYRNPDLGNKHDPVDELVYIILSRKTFEDAYQKGYELLKSHFSSWDDLLKAPRRKVEALIRSGGLSGKKTKSLYGALGKLRDTFGRCTLKPARKWDDEKLEEFLCTLPEIQRKSAYCIMLYAFGRAVFPADTHVGRILCRLGVYRELGLDLEGLDHKQLQRILADLIPPNLRYSLHVNLVAHGRRVCRAVKPDCHSCELKLFCQHYRRQESARVLASDKPGVIDLFAGAGGQSEGFVRAGFKVLGAVEMDEMAVRTYRLNHPGVPESRVLGEDIRSLPVKTIKQLLGGKPLDVLTGSPPCQGFSSAGFRSKRTLTRYQPERDERNSLFEWMVQIALALKPKLFLMENVVGMQSVKREDLSFLDAAARMLRKRGGYRTEVWRLNSASFGVPQDRVRCFLVASRLGAMPARPEPEYRDPRKPEVDIDSLPPVTLDEAIFDLPARSANSGKAVEAWSPPDWGRLPKAKRYLTKFGLVRQSRLLFEHTVRYNNARDLELYALLRPGEDSVHAIEAHGRGDLMRYRKDVFDDKYARLRPDRPCKTIVAHLAKDGNGYIHPTQYLSAFRLTKQRNTRVLKVPGCRIKEPRFPCRVARVSAWYPDHHTASRPSQENSVFVRDIAAGCHRFHVSPFCPSKLAMLPHSLVWVHHEIAAPTNATPIKFKSLAIKFGRSNFKKKRGTCV
jgi:DNA-cytosine methyltransferase